ncbi:Fungal transcriptional regulatory protein, N-terminal [Penicillium camemberti]|uniref:Fungal transcriptional regulatory protein, N-terminal n=1 Tax=Penicillium camemberti (strain FM 013) TaxID=1429867 RepID=A0A0G4PJT3_PENC3|nr:Fungal transcriptional regulatory protein, N-terminal [Penicillium camemberti]
MDITETNTSSGPISVSGLNPRRRRPPLSCSLCRQRKIRCNRQIPCNNCIRSKNRNCVYRSSQPPPQHGNEHEGQTRELGSIPAPQQINRSLDNFVAPSPINYRSAISSGPSRTVTTSSTSPSTPNSHSSTHEIEMLKSKIRQLENQLDKSTKSSTETCAPTPVSDIETTHSHLAGTFHIHNASLPSNQGQMVRRSFIHKKRFFGQSHWISSMSLFRDIVDTIEPHLMAEGSKAILGLQKCKHLGKKIKAQRTPQWPVPMTTDLPSKDICDALVDCYLRTSERVYRVLHIPSFKREYAKFWDSGTRYDPILLVQLKLVLAIGCTTYDAEFSLRSLGVRLIYEAQTWFAEPEYKARLGIPFLQAHILLFLARELLGVDGGMNWIAAGTLIRTAVYMGLHRDPVQIPNLSGFASEMRRRLWNTILEVCLQSSMESGGPALISVEEFDTEPPRNFDDHDIDAEHPIPHPENQLTSSSIAIAFRKTFSIRLAIAKFLNDLGCQGSYEEAVSLDARLRASYKEMCRTIQGYSIQPSQFELLMLDFVIRRYLLSIHIPFFGPSFLATTYAFSRNVVIDTALKLFNSSRISPSTAGPSSNQSTSPDQIDFGRLTMCGSGFLHTPFLHSSVIIAIGLKIQILEEEGLGPVSLRPDLLSAIQDAKALSLECIKIGGTNIKGYLFMSLISTQLDALMQGVPEDELPKLLIKAAEEAEDKCLSILEPMAAKGQNEKTGDASEPESTTLLPDMSDDWDSMMTDVNFDFADMEPVSWMLNSIPYGIP